MNTKKHENKPFNQSTTDTPQTPVQHTANAKSQPSMKVVISGAAVFIALLAFLLVRQFAPAYFSVNVPIEQTQTTQNQIHGHYAMDDLQDIEKELHQVLIDLSTYKLTKDKKHSQLAQYDKQFDDFKHTLAAFNMEEHADLHAILKDIKRLRPMMVKYLQAWDQIIAIKNTPEKMTEKSNLMALINHCKTMSEANNMLHSYYQDIEQRRMRILVDTGLSEDHALSLFTHQHHERTINRILEVREIDQLIIGNYLKQYGVLLEYFDQWSIEDNDLAFKSGFPKEHLSTLRNALLHNRDLIDQQQHLVEDDSH